MTVLARYHIQYPGTTPWVDVTSRVIDRDAKWSEGRNLGRCLGGPLPPAVPATLDCPLDNFDGFFTKGAGMRVRAWCTDISGCNGGPLPATRGSTRYVGHSLGAYRVRFEGSLAG